jgi:hypothetical protein
MTVLIDIDLELHKSNLRLTGTVLAALFGIWLVAALTLGIHYDTNDDVAMSMQAGGYGAAAWPSALIGMQGSIRGYLIQLVPEIFGFDRYAIFNILTLFTSVAVAIYYTHKYSAPTWLLLAVTFVLFFRPLAFPQFTTSVAVIFVAGLSTYLAHPSSLRYMAASSLFFILAASTRLESFIMCALVSVVFLAALRPYRFRFFAQLAALLVIPILLNIVVDSYHYNSPEWKYVLALNAAKTPLLDFGGFTTILRRVPGLLSEFNLSANDISLSQNWWFVDKRIANPELFTSLWQEAKNYHVSLTFQSIVPFLDAAGKTPTIASLALIFGIAYFTETKREAAAILLALGVIFAGMLMLALTGRGVPDRVLHAALIPIGFLVVGRAMPKLIQGIMLPAILLLAIALLASEFVARSREMLTIDKSQKASIAKFIEVLPKDRVHLVWGSAFNMEAHYPVTMRYKSQDPFRFFWLATSQFAPSSQAMFPGGSEGILKAFTGEDGLSMILYPPHIKLLKTYCEERFTGRFDVVTRTAYRGLTHAVVKCIPL